MERNDKMTWKPNLASVSIEEEMEAKNILEKDRDEMRRFAEFLEIKKNMKEGERLTDVISKEMKEWLLGIDIKGI